MSPFTVSPKASVVVPVWNGRQYLPACLDALLSQESLDFEVIVVDNASTDGSADLVAESYPHVRLVRNRDNLGFAGGCNVGLQAAQGEVLILLNQDTRVRPGWLCALVNAVRDPRVGVAGCKILYPDGKMIQHAGGWVEWPLGLTRHYGQGEQDVGQWDVPRQVEYVTGASMAFRRDVLDRLGFLDEGFWPGYYEDVDFCFTVRQEGYEVWYVPEAVLTHEETTSLTDSATISRASHRGRLRFVLKHMSPQRFLDEFVQAELVYSLRSTQSQTRHALRMAYLEAIPVAVTFLSRRWQVGAEVADKVLAALQQLCLSPGSSSLSFNPILHEFEFRSAVPVIGPLIARLCSLWYGVAARWAVRYLIQQQEVINQQQEVMNQLYVRSLVSLSQEVLHVILQLGTEEGRRTVEGGVEEGT